MSIQNKRNSCFAENRNQKKRGQDSIHRQTILCLHKLLLRTDQRNIKSTFKAQKSKFNK